MTFSLSTVDPDFDAIKTQLEVFLQSKDAWKGNLTIQTGQTLLEMIAAVGALDQLTLRRLAEDAFPYTALNDQAIYAIATMLGLRLSRKRPAQCHVIASLPVSQTIPPFTAFSIAGTSLFNRTAFTLTPAPQVIVLYEGYIVNNVTSGIGSDFQTFVSLEDKFKVSDTDISVLVNGIALPKTWDGLWKLKRIPGGYRDRTMPSGQLMIEFGNEQFGSKPSTSDTVEITYAVTKGAEANNIKTKDVSVTCDAFPGLTAVGDSDMSGGADETSPLVYKNIGGTVFGTFGSAVTRDQYRSLVLTYSGVLDGYTFAQREINPAASQWMNLIKVTLLTSTPWAPNQKEAFLQYLQERSMYSTRFYLEDPVMVPVTVSLKIFCYNYTNPSVCRADAIDALIRLFSLRPGILNYNVYRSDIDKAVLTSNKGIEYVVIEEPTSDLLMEPQPINQISYAQHNPSGYLAAGAYQYAISAVFVDGVIAARSWTDVVVNVSNSYVTLSWDAVPGAIGYRIYGRSTSQGIGLLFAIGDGTETPLIPNSTQVSWVDHGTAIPSLAYPLQTTVPMRYASLANIEVVARYSTRNPARSLEQ